MSELDTISPSAQPKPGGGEEDVIRGEKERALRVAEKEAEAALE